MNSVQMPLTSRRGLAFEKQNCFENLQMGYLKDLPHADCRAQAEADGNGYQVTPYHAFIFYLPVNLPSFFLLLFDFLLKLFNGRV